MAPPNDSQTPGRDEEFAENHRPYRSHKVPACDRCRKRKARCTVDLPGQACLLCRLQNAVCKKGVEEDVNVRLDKSRRKRVRVGSPDRRSPRPRQEIPCTTKLPSTSTLNLSASVVPAGDENDEQAAMIVGPAAAEDIHVIEEYMTSKRSPEDSRQNRNYNVISNDRSRPVLYQAVPARRKGLRITGPPGLVQQEIIEQILGPLAVHLTAAYFEHVHPWFPILDRESFSEFPPKGTDVSPALMCQMYAISLSYWNLSPKLACHPRPGIAYVWNLAITAEQEDFLAPSLKTICAALLDMSGRPTASITGNVLTSGKTLALAHSLGLNRDPSAWNITEDSKATRVKLWWAVLIHDQWSSFAHGLPPKIIKDQYDVPLPSRSTQSDESQPLERGWDCFLALCRLTEVLTDILPLIYTLSSKSLSESPRKLTQIRSEISRWEDSLPRWIGENTFDNMNRISADDLQPGTCHLYLSHLAVKMLIERIALRDARRETTLDAGEAVAYHKRRFLESAREVAYFVCSLTSTQLEEYWIPYGAYHIASAGIVLLRFSIDADSKILRNSCKKELEDLIERLREAKDSHDWDMGDLCLKQCQEIVTVIGEGQPSLNDIDMNRPLETSGLQSDAIVLGTPDFLQMQTTWDFATDLQYPWASLWEMVEPSVPQP